MTIAIDTQCEHTPTMRLEWLDRSLPFIDSFQEALVCNDCADALEAEEHIDLLDAIPYP